MISGSQKDFPVMDGDTFSGFLTQKDLLRFLTQRGESTPVSDAMTTEFNTTSEDELLDNTFQKFEEFECKTVAVLRNGKLKGILTLDNIGEFVSIRDALGDRKE